MFGDPHSLVALKASGLAVIISTLGLLSIAFLGDWGRRASSYFSAFAVGFLATAVLFHLIPESYAMSPGSWRWGVYSFFGMLGIGLILRLVAKRSGAATDLAFGYASIIALGAHSFLDGVLYALSFHGEVFTGSISITALLLHEFPEGVIAFFLLKEAGLSRMHSIIVAFFAASFTTLAGTVLALASIGLTTDNIVAALTAATAGGLTYIILFHLGPHASQTPNRQGYRVASLGVVIALATIVLRHM